MIRKVDNPPPRHDRPADLHAERRLGRQGKKVALPKPGKADGPGDSSRHWVAASVMMLVALAAIVINRLYYSFLWLPEYYDEASGGEPPVVVPWDVPLHYMTHSLVGALLTLAVLVGFFGGLIVILWGDQVAALLRGRRRR